MTYWKGVVVSGVPGLVSVLILAVLVSFGVNADSSVVVRADIHPDLSEIQCNDLPGKEAVSDEPDFLSLLRGGRVVLERSDFNRMALPGPCRQRIAVMFPCEEDYYEFMQRMSEAPQLPFWSGADYAIQTAIFERAAHEGDVAAYRILLRKDGRSSNETNPPLYAILRRNALVFLREFGRLSREEKELAVKTQYDFNLPVEDQLIGAAERSRLSSDVRVVADVYNSMMQEVACKFDCKK